MEGICTGAGVDPRIIIAHYAADIRDRSAEIGIASAYAGRSLAGLNILYGRIGLVDDDTIGGVITRSPQ